MDRPAAQQRPLRFSLVLGLLPSGGEAIGLILVALPLLVTFATMDSAQWVTGLPPFPAEVALAVACGYYVARFVRPWRAGIFAGLALGAASAIGQGVQFLGDTSVQTMGTVLLMATWWAAFLTAWLAHRKHSPALLLTPSLVVLLVTLGFLPARYTIMVGVYLVASAPALAHFQLQRWTAAGRAVRPRLSTLSLGVAVMAVIVVGAWLTPTHQEGIRPSIFKRLEDPVFRLLERSSSLLASVPNRKDWPTFDLGEGLPFTGPPLQGNDVIMTVKSTQPYRWRLRVYENYTAQGWTRPSEETESYRYRYLEGYNTSRVPPDYKIIPIEVRTFTTMKVMASAGEPLSAGTGGRVELSPIPQFTLSLPGPQGSYLPPRIEELRQGIAEVWGLGDAVEDPVLEIARRLGAEGMLPTMNLAELEDELTVEGSPLGPAPPLALQFKQERSPPRSYKTLGAVSDAPVSVLRQADAEPPGWVADRYLQLPPDFPEYVSILAEELTRDLQTPYDMAVALESYLRDLPYQAEVVPPPADTDGVLWFLQVQRVGFCQYYASAMITMLRSLGIPARLVTGFAPGDWDEDRNAWVVRSKHYHAWPEVYISGHGWVEFEPTPANVQPALQYLGHTLELRIDEPTPDDDLGECEGYIPEFDAPSGPCDEEIVAAEASTQEGLLEDGGDGTGVEIFNVPVRLVLYWLAGAAGLVLVIALGANLFSRRPVTGQRQRDYPGRVFSSMLFLGRVAGVPRLLPDTPSEYGARLSRLLPEQATDVARITEAYQYTHYGSSKQLDAQQLELLRTSWPPVRRALAWRVLGRLQPRWPFATKRLRLAARP